ncbi:MAG: apolipoprotein N-acyltransferase [Ignavibacteria bacterium]
MKSLKFWHKIPVTPEERKLRKQHRLYGILSGVLMGLSFPPVPFPFTILMFFGLLPYFSVLGKKEKLIDINRFTYLTFFVFNVITIYWVGSWSKEADPFLMTGGFLLLFLNPAIFLIPSTLYYHTKKILNKNIAFLLFPFFWVSCEYLYMLTDLSFPWLTLGNGLTYFNLFIQCADIAGALGLSLIVLFINVGLFFAFRNYKEKRRLNYYGLICAALLFIIPCAYGMFRLSYYKISDRTTRVGLIQPNLNPWEKWNGGDVWQLTKEYLELSQKAVDNGAKIIFWPETALPVYLRDGAYRNIIDSLDIFVRRNNVSLITGMPDFRLFPDKASAPPDAKYSRITNTYYAVYNSVLLFTPNSYRHDHYGKMKLVPFGERVPFVDALPFLGEFIKWNVGISGWNVGRDTTVFKIAGNVKYRGEISRQADTVKINSLVCFESVYPDFVAAFTQKGAQLISVVTNDSWYGNSSGPYQHKEIGVLRAVENRRAVVRAANGGISTIIDPFGHTLSCTKMYQRTYLTGDVPLETRMTFFSEYPLLIPLFSSAVSVLLILLIILHKLYLLISLKNKWRFFSIR